MTWTPIPLGPSVDGVTVTVTKKWASLAFGTAALRALTRSDDALNVSVSLGDGPNVGWLLVVLDEDGASLQLDGERRVLALPRSGLPDLLPCRSSPLVWRRSSETDAAIEVRLPTIAVARAPAMKPKPRLAVDNNRAPSEAVDESTGIDLIAVPDLYKGLHAAAWAAGVEVAFLSDGNCVVNGKVVSTEEMETIVNRQTKKESA